MASFKGHSDGKVIIPEEPVALPRGKTFNVTIEEIKKKSPDTGGEWSFLKLAREIADQQKGVYPEDLAENHDHYLYGGKKR
jgi:hypothetical protein